MKIHSRSIAAAAAGAALLISGLSACSSTRSTRGQLSDAAITSKVKTKLAADPQVNPFNIDVDTDEGVVRLSGMVEKSVARTKAEKLARDTEGVRDVVNDIELGDPTIGEEVDDAWIATKIKAKLTADEDINPFNIDVDVNQRRVTLTGRVNNRDERARAEGIAAGVKGVSGVDNRLEVGKVDD